jgi:hypothetical protein
MVSPIDLEGAPIGSSCYAMSCKRRANEIVDGRELFDSEVSPKFVRRNATRAIRATNGLLNGQPKCVNRAAEEVSDAQLT